MKTAGRGFGKPKTLRNKLDRFKARTPTGALLELTRLTQEKERLRQEIGRWEKRFAEIQTRLNEIAEMETWLYRFVEPPHWPEAEEKRQPIADEPGPTALGPGPNEVTLRY